MSAKALIVTLLIFPSLFSVAGSGKSLKDSATVIIKLSNAAQAAFPVDSVYVIFDRFDLTGAGVVKQVYYPVNNELQIVVPKGKYYIDLICLGHYPRHYDWVLKAKAKKKNEIALQVDPVDSFTPGLVILPPEKIDFTDLAVTRYTSFK